MNDEPNSFTNPAAALRPWDECEIFCIDGYARGVSKACGWRGRWNDIPEATRLCPRCGRAALIPIPPPAAQCWP